MSRSPTRDHGGRTSTSRPSDLSRPTSPGRLAAFGAGNGGADRLERTRSTTSSYYDPEFAPEVHLSPVVSRASRRDLESTAAGHETVNGYDGNGGQDCFSSDADTRSTTIAPETMEKDHIEVTWDGPGDKENPLNMSAWRKWLMVAILSFSCVSITCCSSMAAQTYPGMSKAYNISKLVCVLSISCFVLGLGTGPLLLGPVSEFLGRAPVLHYGFLCFFLLNFPVAFSNTPSVHFMFRYLTGFAGSGFLSVSGGLVTDVFENAAVATPMTIWSVSPFMGPVMGPLISGFINYNQPDWRWTYYVVLIWAFVCLVALVLCVPETFAPKLLARKARRLRKETGQNYRAPLELKQETFLQALMRSIKTPFVLLCTQPMVLLLDLWSALLLGILYLSFGGIPFIFKHQYGFNMQETGLAFLGIGVGQLIAAATQPLFNKYYAKVASKSPDGKAPPETRLYMGQYGAVLAPIGLLLLGLTCFKHVHWMVPIVMSLFFGTGLVYAFNATFTYLVDAYRPVAASALASNSFMRSSFAAGFPLFGNQMYARLGPVGATCLLAGLLFCCLPFPFVFKRIGARIRAKSQFAAP